MAKFETTFSLGQRVLIVALDKTPAVVRAVKVNEMGVTYYVVWFANGKREEDWLYPDELTWAP